MAQPLLRQMNTHGAFQTPAKFIPTWNSPVDEVPSPKNTIDTSSLPITLAAYAEPTACGICVPTGELIDTRLSQLAEWCTGICRPFTGSWMLPNSWLMKSLTVYPRQNHAPCSR